MKLYHSKLSRSARVLWLLEEMGVACDVEAIDLGKGESKTAAFRKLNPHAAVPVLVEDGQTLIESGAIVAHLTDMFPTSGLAPAPGTAARGKYYQWLFYTVATMEPPILQVFLHTNRLPEAERNPAIAEAGRTQFKEVARFLSAALTGKQFLVEDTFSAADIMVGSTLTWCRFLGLLDEAPVLQEYVKRLTDRPAFQRAYSR